MWAVNPARLSLDSPNVILTGRNTRYHVPDFEGPLSIKAVVAGRAVWETADGRHALGPGAYLVLNRRQRYTITIDQPTPAETFCVFFERGFVEDVRRALTCGDAALVDAPDDGGECFELPEVIEPGGAVLPALEQVRAALRDRDAVDDRIRALAETLVRSRADTMARIARLPALRASTRSELYRRLMRARARLDETMSAMDVPAMAQVACLSPHHFHRLFTRLFGETPHRYAVRQRMARAAEQLRKSDRSTLEIALAHGFESVGSFTTLFRRHYGLPPAAWRKKQR